MGTDVESRETRGWDDLHGDAVRVMTEAARLRRPVGPNLDGVESHDRGERVDFGEFVSLVLAATAANVGGIEELLAGRPGSWEADYVRNLLTSTVGWGEEYLWEHRTEPVVIRVPVDGLLADTGLWRLYEESEAAIEEMEDAVGVVYDVCDDTGTWTPSDPAVAPLTESQVAQRVGWARPGARVDRMPTPDQERELERLADLRDRLDRLQEAEWAAYGEAFKASVVAELAREPLAGLKVPVEFDIHARLWQTTTTLEGVCWGPLARLYEAGWLHTPLPGSGIAPQDYPAGTEVVQVERDAGRLPHLRIPTTVQAVEASEASDRGMGDTGERGGERR